MRVHTVGDSHSENGWQNVIKHHVGPTLCFSVGREKLNRVNISTFSLQEGDIIIFCFGEIDCRCHIHKHISHLASYASVIDSIVDNYFEAIRINVETAAIRLKHVCVFNVVPPVQRCNTWENPEYPYLGSDEERKQYALYFNQKLKQKCSEYGYVFFDVYDKYADANGFLRKDLSDDNVHIKNGLYLTEFIRNHLL